VHLVLYGDFNCPFSALDSDRAARLEQTGTATVDWRAVEHAPDISRTGDSAASIEEVDRELEQVYALLVDGEDLHLARPARPSNSRAAVEAYAAVEPNRRAEARVALFRAYWSDGRDLSDEQLLASLGGGEQSIDLTASWRSEWLAADRPIVPMLRLADGYVSRGLGALARLADMLEL
jgi:predicted DsbA family dithiol-disulfide isomerase